MNIEITIKKKIVTVLPHLNERQKRIFLAAEAESFGYGGVSKVSRASGFSRPTIIQGKKELFDQQPPELPKSRKIGGGRKKIYEKTPTILKELEKLIDPLTRGDPMSPLRWTCKSTRNLANTLKKKGYQVSHTVVGEMLKYLGYSLQSNQKANEGSDHPDRDEQFNYINTLSENYISNNLPVISVDTKKKELVGEYKNNGKEWQPKGQPERVKDHDFPDKKLGKAVPYGIYDLGNNEGFVNVGCSYETSTFAVESIRRWWLNMGKEQYNKSKGLLIMADSGGSNGYRRKLWKKELQNFSNDSGLEITVCHFPPGTSKWNKIEHRMFSYISMNWRGKPLTSYETIVNLIGSTRTRKGLKIKATIDYNKYKKGIEVTDKEMKSLRIEKHEFHGEWNYTIKPIMQ